MTAPDPVIERIRAEYLEMPGMRLTTGQVARLCGVDPAVCQQALDQLVDANFLAVNPDGGYARRTEEGGQMKMAKAALPTAKRRRISRRGVR